MQNKKRHVISLAQKARQNHAQINASSCPQTISPKAQESMMLCVGGNALLVAENQKEQSQSLREYQKMREQYRELLGDKY
jgi:hypothetical protein